MTEKQDQQEQCECVKQRGYKEYKNGLCFYCWNQEERKKTIESIRKQREAEGTDQSTVLY